MIYIFSNSETINFEKFMTLSTPVLLILSIIVISSTLTTLFVNLRINPKFGAINYHIGFEFVFDVALSVFFYFKTQSQQAIDNLTFKSPSNQFILLLTTFWVVEFISNIFELSFAIRASKHEFRTA